MSAAPSVTSAEVRRILAQQLGYHVDQIAEDATFDQLEMDSLDNIELAMALEDHFRIEIRDDEVNRLATVAGAVVLVTAKQAEAPRA